MRKELKKMLQALSFEHKCRKYPNVPKDSIPPTSYNDSKANGLTKCIYDFLIFHGHQASLNSTGRLIDRREKITDAIGRRKVIGSIEWVKEAGKAGSGDISAIINGRSVNIKIKTTSQAPKYSHNHHSIEKAWAIHFTASDFDMFFDWYQKTFTTINSFNG